MRRTTVGLVFVSALCLGAVPPAAAASGPGGPVPDANRTGPSSRPTASGRVAIPAPAAPRGRAGYVVRSVQQIAAQAVAAAPGSEPDTVIEPDVQADPADPRVVVATFQQGRYPDGASVDPGYAWSHDGGQTWRHANLPKLTAAVGGHFDRASDPVVAFGPGGVVYISTLALSFGTCESAVLVSRSTDGGRSFGAPLTEQYTRNCRLQEDKKWITVDTDRSSPHYGRVYGPWSRFAVDAHGNEVSAAQVLRYSDDGGRTWSRLVHISSYGGSTQGSQLLVLPGGHLVDLYTRYGSRFTRFFLLARTSSDGGRSWTRARLVSEILGTGVPDIRDGATLTSATVDSATGQLYVSWQDSRYRGPVGSDVLLSRSGDGVHWSRPTRVNADPVGDRTYHFTPDVAAANGRVHVSWRTRRDENTRVGFEIAASADRGSSFGWPLTLGPVADTSVAAVGSGVPFYGDYQGLTAAGGRVYAVWCVSTPMGAQRYHQVLWGAALT